MNFILINIYLPPAMCQALYWVRGNHQEKHRFSLNTGYSPEGKTNNEQMCYGKVQQLLGQMKAEKTWVENQTPEND